METSGVLTQVQDSGQADDSPRVSPAARSNEPAVGLPPLVCNLSAMSAEQRTRHQQVIRQFFSEAVVETRELADGLAFRSDGSNFLTAAEFVSLERLCCTFFNFTLAVDSANPFFWLIISGPEGVKAFLRDGFGSLPSTAKQG